MNKLFTTLVFVIFYTVLFSQKELHILESEVLSKDKLREAWLNDLYQGNIILQKKDSSIFILSLENVQKLTDLFFNIQTVDYLYTFSMPHDKLLAGDTLYFRIIKTGRRFFKAQFNLILSDNRSEVSIPIFVNRIRTNNSDTRIRARHIKREFSMCSFNQLIADTERKSINKKLETIEVFDFFGHRTFYRIYESTVIGCYLIEPGLDDVVKFDKLYQHSSDSLMIDAFLKGGKTEESVLKFGSSTCNGCPGVSYVVYKIRRRSCPKIISSTLIIDSYML